MPGKWRVGVAKGIGMIMMLLWYFPAGSWVEYVNGKLSARAEGLIEAYLQSSHGTYKREVFISV